MAPLSAHLHPVKQVIHLNLDRFHHTDEEDTAKTWCLWSFLDTERVIPSTGRPRSAVLDLLEEVKRPQGSASLFSRRRPSLGCSKQQAPVGCYWTGSAEACFCCQLEGQDSCRWKKRPFSHLQRGGWDLVQCCVVALNRFPLVMRGGQMGMPCRSLPRSKMQGISASLA